MACRAVLSEETKVRSVLRFIEAFSYGVELSLLLLLLLLGWRCSSYSIPLSHKRGRT